VVLIGVPRATGRGTDRPADLFFVQCTSVCSQLSCCLCSHLGCDS
jgi:hypothetical protein